jgi:hypothetical protein
MEEGVAPSRKKRSRVCKKNMAIRRGGMCYETCSRVMEKDGDLL